MRARHKLLLITAAVLTAALVGMVVLAWGLMQQAATEAAVATMNGEPGARWAESVAAAGRVMWLGAGAIGAVLLGISALATRRWLVADLEQLDRLVTRDNPVSGDDEISRLRTRFASLQQEVRQLQDVRSAGLMAVADYRDALADVTDQLAVADRLALTGQVSLGVAHEAGAQLAIAQVALDMLPTLDRAEDAADAEQLIVDLQSAVSRLTTILDDINTLGLQQDDLGRAARVRDVCKRVARLSRLHRKSRHADITFGPADTADDDAEVQMDAGRLEQVLLNLVINAADATGGAGTIAVRWRRVEQAVQLTVEDDGPGVPDGQKARIFEPFVTTKPPAEGSGLGLAVSRQLVATFAGQLQLVTAEELGGACFMITLPGGG